MLQHVTLEIARDRVDACVRFWGLLGFAPMTAPPLLRDRFTWVAREGTQIHLMYVGEPVTPPEGHVAVIVDDYERTLAVLREAGRDPEPRTEHWGSPRAFVRDPAGNRVELMAFPPG